jgi:hypothetical protein
VGRHSDAIDVTGPMDVIGLKKRLAKRRRNLTLCAIAAAIIVATAVALLLAG